MPVVRRDGAGAASRASRAYRPRVPRHVAARLVACVAVALAALFAAPACAHAESFDTTRVDISAAVLPDGDLQVTELRTLEFDDDVNGVFWTLPISQNQQGTTVSYNIGRIEAIGEDESRQSFSQVEFAENGDAGVFTAIADSTELEVKLFSPQESGDIVTFSLSYTLTGAVMAWSDTAELYWQFVGPGWEVDSNDVTLKVSFPDASLLGAGEQDGGSAADGAASEGLSAEDVRAWAHGPLDGSVSIDLTEPSVSFAAPRVSSGEFAEARIAFPVDWVPGLSADASERLPTILDEERQWAEEANARREQARTVAAVGSAVLLGAGFLVLVAAIAFKFTRGRSSRPQFQDTYFRDVPSSDHPAVIAAFMEGGSVPDSAFVATLMHLTDERVIELSLETTEKRGLLGSKKKSDYRMTLADPARAASAIDRAAIDLYFGYDASQGASVLFGSVGDEAKGSPKDYSKRLEDFKAEVSAHLEMRGLIQSRGGEFQAAMLGLGALVVVGGVFFLIATDGAALPATLAAMLLALAAIFVSFTFRRYSREGVELKARCEALKRWLEDFTRLSEAVPDDLVLWNKLLVMAVALGVSDEVLRKLADAVPRDLREDEFGGYYYPVYWWCYPHVGLGSPAHEMQGVHQATISELAASLDSSSGGFGGGFSGGGGGGVGGGGGGSF